MNESTISLNVELDLFMEHLQLDTDLKIELITFFERTLVIRSRERMDTIRLLLIQDMNFMEEFCGIMLDAKVPYA